MGKEIEIEVEIEVADLGETEKRLKELDAVLVERAEFHSIYFDRKKFYENKRIRLRKINTTYPEKKSYCVYTEKSPKAENGVQIADEREKIVDFREMFEKLKPKGIAFEARLNATKYRINNSTVELRESIGIMKYVEIEGQSREDVSDTMNLLNIKGKILSEGALNRSLEIMGKKKIQVLQ